jgi:hypothetical protein
MIHQFLKNKTIKKLLVELNRAKKHGHIVFITDITDIKIPGGCSEVVGIEIIFTDKITDDQVCKIRKYIEANYKFKVDTSLMELGRIPRILLVMY